jgi:transposase-like protein
MTSLEGLHEGGLTKEEAKSFQTFEPCPMGGEHDTSGEMVNQAGYSCNKCHKTWNRNWEPTYGYG